MCIKFKIKNATFSYDGKRTIFENISFSIEKGDILCILGQNGCGKSTLLRCLCNLYKLNAGNIYIDDKDIVSYSPANLAKKIGFIPQMHTPSFPYSVLQIVMMGRTAHLNMFSNPSKKDYEIAQKAIKTMHLEHIMHKPYTELSGGQMQLVLMARVLAQGPDILLLDEPTSHLDISNQLYTIKMVKKLSQRGFTIIMTSHFPDHTFLSYGKVGIMKDKRLLDIGLADDVVTDRNLEEIYGIPFKILYVEEIKRKIVIPFIKD